MKAQASGLRMQAAKPYQNPNRLSGTRPCTCCSRLSPAVFRAALSAVEAPLRDCPVVPPSRWGIVVPVKRLTIAKTRLQSYGDAVRQDLALAFALDVVAAGLGCDLVEAVLVVT